MASNNVHDLFIRQKYTQKEIIADKRVLIKRIEGLLITFEDVVKTLTEEDLLTLYEYKKFISKYDSSSGANDVQTVNGIQLQPRPVSATKPLNSSSQVQSGGIRYESVEEEPILYFKPSDKFTGSRPGWVFKTGEHGLGYYMDLRIGI